jgi:hypothetical protein
MFENQVFLPSMLFKKDLGRPNICDFPKKTERKPLTK